jgi:hypothetical protein
VFLDAPGPGQFQEGLKLGIVCAGNFFDFHPSS